MRRNAMRITHDEQQSRGVAQAIFVAAAGRLGKTDTAGAARLRQASPHWLRHGYARALVDHAVPLPAAQALLGHASVQPTAAYYRQ
ncbi:tyrosine-type recombinase/integrase [Burkholderia sp. 4M9327F10]|uniref:tyrosine-type recombinase/integrase n=1 Tax=Burkholderia sp. 4M9327F10 TaxID=2502223 RepID=UPI0024B603F2|nr:tyrosine-type recombinase/integrase [Burkholderia sp. 4M9327F10]